MVANLEEPHTLKEALERDDSTEWREAWVSEVDSLARNNTWRLEPRPPGRQAIGCRWLFKQKEERRYKARLVAKGYAQREGVDYTETFAPVTKFNSLGLLLALVCECDWELDGLEVKTAFLNSEIKETVYKDIPDGLEQQGSSHNPSQDHPLVCQLMKSISGLKQSPRVCYGRINWFFINHGFVRSQQDHNVYVHSVFKLILLLYVDDLVITAPNVIDVHWIRNLLHEEFEMTDLGPLTVFLELEVRRDPRLRTLHLSQQRYIQTILDRFFMSAAAPISAPADPHVRLKASPPEHEADQINQQRFQGAVRFLMYAMVRT